jgi:hypothetical protein
MRAFCHAHARRTHAAVVSAGDLAQQAYEAVSPRGLLCVQHGFGPVVCAGLLG